ncbi:MAG: hypothetical protein ACFNOM_00960 [Parascardovia denticolens]
MKDKNHREFLSGKWEKVILALAVYALLSVLFRIVVDMPLVDFLLIAALAAAALTLSVVEIRRDKWLLKKAGKRKGTNR